MPTVLRFRRGDTTASNAFTGAEGELFVDTSKDTVVVHDGVTAGGKPLATEAALTSGLAGKADASALTSGLAGKADASALTSGLAGKADASALTSGLAGKQETLVSGTNIKTVNGTSILGSGNISISGGSGGGDLTQVASDITPLFDSVYDLGSTDNRFYDAYLANKLNINDATLSGTSTLVSPAIAAIPGSTTTTPVEFTASLVNGSSYVMGLSFTAYSATPGDAWNTWAASNWNQARLIGATIQITSLQYGTYTRTITGFNGSGPYYGFNINTDGPSGWDSNIVSVTITYNNTVVVQAVPGADAVYDRTLASNATIVAPTVVADTALLGNNLVELDTITPEHILGEYTDAKGTLIVDGSLKVNDDLSVRNNITLQQDAVTLGTVVSKDTSTSLVNTEIATAYQPNTWYTAFGAYLLVDYDGRIQSSYGNFMSYPGFAGLTSGAEIVINLVDTGYTWTYTVTSVSYDGMYTNINYTPLSSTSPWSTIYAFNQATLGYSQGFGSGPMYGGHNAGMSGSSSVTTTVLTLDKLTTPLTSGIKLAINDDFASAPVNQSLSVTGSLSSNGLYNESGNQYQRYLTTNGESWENPTTQGVINTKAIFTAGNQVSITYNGNTGVYNVVSTLISGNTQYNFELSFVSGYDFVQMGGIDYAFGMMMQPINWSANVALSTNYTTEYAPSLIASTTNNNKYISTSSTFNWLDVGDTLSYVPVTSSIKFKKDDGTSVKAITYNNSTGTITYDGIVQTVSISTNGNIRSANAIQPSNGSNSIALGTSAQGIGDSSVAIGYSAGADSTEGVAIGAISWAQGQQATAVGKSTQALGFSSTAIGHGAFAGGDASTALGKGAYVNSQFAGATAIAPAFADTGYQGTYFFGWYAKSIPSGATNKLYIHKADQYSSTYQSYMAYDLGQVFSYYDFIARGKATVLIKGSGGTNHYEYKVIEIDLTINSTGNYSYSIVQTQNTITSGPSAMYPGSWSAAFELINNRYLVLTFTKNDGAIAAGISGRLQLNTFRVS